MGVRVRERDGAWWVFVNHQGRRKAKRIGIGDAGKKAAKTAAAKIQAKLVLGDVGILDTDKKAVVPTFEEVAKQWEQLTSPDWKRGTAVSYGNVVRHRLLPSFGSLPITEVTGERVETWWTGVRDEGLSKVHLRTMRGVLRGICRRAVRLGLIRSNPVEWIEGKLGRQTGEIRKKADYLTRQELTRLLGIAERVCPTLYPVLLVMATAGLRVGEALALQVGDLDALGLKLHIRRTVRRGYVDSPKSGKAGIVDVPPTTMAVLARIAEIRQAEAAVQGVEARWLFPGGNGPEMPAMPEAVQKALRRALKAAGIRMIRPHDLRHTFATLAIQAGVPILTVSRQLRHASISTTVDVYAHAVPGSNRAAAEVMETILTGNQTQPPCNLPS
ncbi:MAG: site-specific integrase [Candidatus Methylomirabilota bacterium]|jgi:integrase